MLGEAGPRHLRTPEEGVAGPLRIMVMITVLTNTLHLCSIIVIFTRRYDGIKYYDPLLRTMLTEKFIEELTL